MKSRAARLGAFCLDDAGRQIVGSFGAIPLRPKTYAVLSYLAANAGRVIGKDELLEAVWPNVNVTDDAIAHCILEARRALGEEGKSLIKTVPRRGYLLEPQVGRSLRPSDWESNLADRTDALPFARQNDLAVVATASRAADPHCAVVRFCITDDLDIIFSSHRDTDQVRDLKENSKASVAIGWESERSLQLGGCGKILKGGELDDAREKLRISFSHLYPGRHSIDGIQYIKIVPQWMRFTDFRLNPISILTVDLIDGTETRSTRIIRTRPCGP